MLRELHLQRLFSTFANGMPGAGLLLQRLLAAAMLLFGAAAHTNASLQAGSQILDIGVGLLLLAGLWTPVAGAVVAVRELWLILAGGDPWMCVVLGALGATLAMIGPGAWSIDARLFGRKQIRNSR